MKLIHAADLHIDSPMRGLARYEGAPVDRMRAATRHATVALVELCLIEEVDVLLLAGDVFDGAWKDYTTGLFFAQQMSALRQGGIRVVSLRGNHDAASEVQKHLVLPENVRELATRQPDSAIFEDIGLVVHGQGFAKRAVTDDLAAGYPDPLAGMLNVGLLHTCLTGRPGHERYAPCRLETLVDRGYDYWALGHVHQREMLHERPTIAFSGNLQGRHVRETGPKGALLIEARDGRVQRVDFRALDTVRWSDLHVDASAGESAHDVVDLVRQSLESEVLEAGGRPLAARVTVMGRTAAHEIIVSDQDRWDAAVRAVATDVGEIWLERVRFRTTPTVDVASLVSGDDALAQVARRLVSLREDPSERAELLTTVDELVRRLPREARAMSTLGSSSHEATLELMDDVSALLLSRLGGMGETE